MNYLKSAVEYKEKSNIGPLIYVKTGEKPLVLLGFYRNILAHFFINEGIIACALQIEGEKNLTADINKILLKGHYDYLQSLLKKEYICQLYDFEKAFNSLQNQGIVIESEGKLFVKIFIVIFIVGEKR